VSPRRALITGITGQDGSYLAQLLAAQGAQLHGLVMAGDPQIPMLRELVPDVKLHEGDLTDSQSIRAAIADSAPEEIYHLAAASSVAASWEDPALTSELNGTGTVRVLDEARKFGGSTGSEPRVLLCSTAEMFGHPTVSPQNELTPINPVSPYGAVKAFTHTMARISRDRGQFVAAAILYNHESPRRPDTFVTRKISKAVARIAHGSTEPLVLGNLDARRDWGFAGDYVKAMTLMLRADEPDDFVIATGVSHTIEDFVESAFRAAGIAQWRNHIGINESFLRPNDPMAFVGDASKADSVLGWRPDVKFDELVDMMVRSDLALLDRL